MTTPASTAPERPDTPLSADAVRALRVELSPREMQRAAPDIDYAGIMRDAAARTNPAIFDAAVGSLGVLGYGRGWLAGVLGLPQAALRPGQRRILPYRMRLVLTAAIRIGSRWATPESTGQTARQIEDIQNEALSLGFRVPAAYSDRYVPEADVCPPEPTRRPLVRTEREAAVAKVQMLAYFCAHGGSEAALGRRFGLATRTVGRTRRVQIGLQVDSYGVRQGVCSAGQDDLVAEIAKAASAVSLGKDPVQVWERLHAYAAQRSKRLAAQEAPRAARESVAA